MILSFKLRSVQANKKTDKLTTFAVPSLEQKGH